jgi:hypothetical protein
MLQQRVSVALVDLVTIRHANLYGELLEFVGQEDPTLGLRLPTTYAAACRWVQMKKKMRFQSWSNRLIVGRPLPTMPLWLTDNLAVPLELETSYEQACDLVDIK